MVQKGTKAKLGATAGLRLLQEGKADHILAAVKKFLAASPFSVDNASGVSILDGNYACFCCMLCMGTLPCSWRIVAYR